MKGARSKSRTVRIPAWFREPFHELYHEIAPAAIRLGLKVYLVGGAVRDLLEARGFSGEWDLVVFGGGDDGARSLAGDVSRARGGGEPVVFPRFGTCLLPGPHYRIEFAQAHLRTSMTSISPDPLLADALSRDFTLNALYVELAEPDPPEVLKILDPGGRGLADLGKGVLRTPIAARLTFEDDPLRIFRAARLRACYSYRIDPSMGRAARSVSIQIPDIAPERIFEEMNRILLAHDPSYGLEMLGRWRAFDLIIPEIRDMVGFRQNNPYHFPDLFRHTLRVVQRCPADLVLRWAALLHDCGKPSARILSDEGESYHGHEADGAELAGILLKRLKAGRKLISNVTELIRLHMVHYQDEWSDRAVRRFILRAGEHLDRLLALVEADSASLRLRRTKLNDLDRLRKRVEIVMAAMPKPRSPLTGRQIMELLDIETGMDVGRAKTALLEAVVEGEILPEEDAARRFLLKWWQEGGKSS